LNESPTKRRAHSQLKSLSYNPKFRENNRISEKTEDYENIAVKPKHLQSEIVENKLTESSEISNQQKKRRVSNDNLPFSNNQNQQKTEKSKSTENYEHL